MQRVRALESLRPLNVGELLDASVALTLRAFVPLALAYVGFAALSAALELATSAYVGRSASHASDAIGTLRRAGAIDPRTIAHALTRSQAMPERSGLLLAAALLLIVPLPLGALVVCADRCASGEAPSVVDAYLVAFRRWVPLVAIVTVFGVGLGLFTLIVLFAWASEIAIVIVAWDASSPIAAAIAVALLLVTFLGWVAIALVGLAAANVAFCSCVLDGSRIRAAIEGSVRSIAASGRDRLGRALALGAATAAIAGAGTVAESLVQSLVVVATRSIVLGEIAEIPIDVASAVFTWVFVTLYYLDLRVRDDGADLRLAARSLVDRA